MLLNHALFSPKAALWQKKIDSFHHILCQLISWFTLFMVRVDIFYRGFTPEKQAKVDIFGSLVLLMPVNLFIFFISYDYVMSAWRILEDSQAAGGIPGVFLLKSLILVFAFTMVLQGIAEVIRNILKISQQKHTNKAVAK